MILPQTGKNENHGHEKIITKNHSKISTEQTKGKNTILPNEN